MALLTKQGTEFALWAAGLLSVAVGILMYQQSRHSGRIIDYLAGAGSPGGSIAPSTAGYQGQSPATGVWSPLGPPGATAFPYMPRFDTVGQANAWPGINPSRQELALDLVAPKQPH